MNIDNPVVLEAIRSTIKSSEATDTGRAELDAIALVSLLARARIKQTGEKRAEAELYASKILCFVFDPVKARRTDHAIAMQRLRDYFSGISKSHALSAEFNGSLTEELLHAQSAGDAIELGAERLFSRGKPKGMTL